MPYPRNDRRAPVLCLGAITVLLFAGVPTAQAFESIPIGSSSHDRITSDAAGVLGWSGAGLDALQQAVRAPDVSESKAKLEDGRVVVLDAAGDYEPSHHCDRLPPASDADAFTAASKYVNLERDEAIGFLRGLHGERAVAALGRALHALQDCHSHSDVSEKDPWTQAGFQKALLVGGPVPSGVRFTGFQPGADLPEMPLGDEYPHGLHSKDGPKSNDDAKTRLQDGRTRFEAAQLLATSSSQRFLEGFLEDLTPTEKAELFAVSPQELPDDAFISAPGAGVLLMLICVASVAVRRLRQ